MYIAALEQWRAGGCRQLPYKHNSSTAGEGGEDIFITKLHQMYILVIK